MVRQKKIDYALINEQKNILEVLRSAVLVLADQLDNPGKPTIRPAYSYLENELRTTYVEGLRPKKIVKPAILDTLDKLRKHFLFTPMVEITPQEEETLFQECVYHEQQMSLKFDEDRKTMMFRFCKNLDSKI